MDMLTRQEHEARVRALRRDLARTEAERDAARRAEASAKRVVAETMDAKYRLEGIILGHLDNDTATTPSKLQMIRSAVENARRGARWNQR